MMKKVIAGVCAAVTVLSCAAFCAVDATRKLDGPLFYHHYITYNVTEAFRSTSENPEINPTDLDVAYDDPRYFPVAAAINTRHVLDIESAELNLGEYGAYTLRIIGNLSDLENDSDMRNREAQQPPILDRRFKTGATALAFELEDLKALSERLDGAGPVTAEQLLIRYNYDGNVCEEIIPFRITLFTGDSQVGQLTDTGDGPESRISYGYENRYAERFWSFSLNPDCTVTQTTLPYAQELQDVLTMSPEPKGTYKYDITIRTPESFFTTCYVAQAGLYCIQLHFLIEGTDAAGNHVSTFSTNRVSYLSNMPKNVQNELQQREGGAMNG